MILFWRYYDEPSVRGWSYSKIRDAYLLSVFMYVWYFPEPFQLIKSKRPTTMDKHLRSWLIVAYSQHVTQNVTSSAQCSWKPPVFHQAAVPRSCPELFWPRSVALNPIPNVIRIISLLSTWTDLDHICNISYLRLLFYCLVTNFWLV